MIALLAACARDADLDGFAGKDDCDDEDALVYPGAPDDPGDGVDGDCSGADAEVVWTGDWEVTSLSATTGGFDFTLPEECSGTLGLDEDGDARVDLVLVLDPLLLGFELAVPVALTGEASRAPGRDAFVLYADGRVALLYDELVHVDFDCAVEPDDGLLCEGEIKALETSLTGTVTFVRPD